jgi:phosphoglycerol transferase MdoB-like AlkP superfamily enzyme
MSKALTAILAALFASWSFAQEARAAKALDTPLAVVVLLAVGFVVVAAVGAAYIKARMAQSREAKKVTKAR